MYRRISKSSSSTVPSFHADLLEHALVREGTSALHVTALQALLGTASDDFEIFAKRYFPRTNWLKTFLGHVDDEGREIAESN